MLRTGLFLLESISSGVFLWLGLYLITRDKPAHSSTVQRWWQRPAIAVGVAAVCEACAFVGLAMQLISDDPQKLVLWQRLTWWPEPLALPTLFWGVNLVTADEEGSPRAQLWGRITFFLLLVYAIGLAAVGTTTSFIFQFDAIRRVPRPPHYLEIPPSLPGHTLFEALAVGTLLLVTFLLARRYYATRNAARGQFKWLRACHEIT